MKKINRLLSVAFLCLFFTFTYSQTENIEWFDGFESGGGDWAASNGVWEVGTPTTGPALAFDGNLCAATVLAGNYPVSSNTRLARISSFSVPNASENPRLRFWHWFSTYSSDYGIVQVKNVDSTEWVSVSIPYTYVSSYVWSYSSIDLSAFEGQTIQVGFLFHSHDSGYGGDESSGWYIDNVSLITGDLIFNNPENWETGIGDWHVEGGSWEVGEPTSGPSSVHSYNNCAGINLGGNYYSRVESRLISPPVLVPNSDNNPRLRFWHWFSTYTYDYGIVQIKNVDSTDWVNISMQYTYVSSGAWSYSSLNLSAYEDQTVEIAFLFHSHDSGYGGDESTGWYIDDISIETGPLLFNNPENWETGIGDWHVEGGTWEIGEPLAGPSEAHSYDNCAGINLSGNYYSRVESRLISPPVQVPNSTENPRLRFWHWYSTYSSDYGKVQIKNVDSTDWVDISINYTYVSSGVWSYSALDLSAYESQIVEIAFLFHSHDSGYGGDESTGWYIDDISIVTGPLVFNNPENWESGIGDWHVEGGTWEIGEPTSGPNISSSGPNCAGTNLGGYYSVQVDSKLISPLTAIPPTSENPRLSFQHWFSFSSGDYGIVQIKPLDSLNWINLSTQYTNTSGSTWSPANISLMDYSEQLVYIAFVFHSHDAGYGVDESFGWYIDEILIDDDSGMTVDAGDDFTLPYGGSEMLIANVIGGTYPFTFEWTPEEGLSDPTSQIPFASPLQTTTYHLKVTDDNGAYRTDNITIYVPYTLELTAFLEGSYDGPLMATDLNSGGHLPLDQPYDMAPWNYIGDESVASIPNGNIVDWVLVELRETAGDASSAKYFTRVDRFAAFLKNDGSIVDMDGSSIPEITVPISQNLYVVIWHRNHLEIMSSNEVPMASGHFSYDLSSSSSVIYGGNGGCKQLDPGVWGMIAGDGESTGNINNLDKNDAWLQQYGLSGYYKGDYNLDGIIDDSDKNDFWIPNVGLGTRVE